MRENAVYTYLRGGLGNQLFIYASARAAQLKYGDKDTKIHLDMTKYLPQNCIHGFQLCDDVILEQKMQMPERLERAQQFFVKGDWRCKNPRAMYKRHKRLQKIYVALGIIRCDDGYLAPPEKMKTPILLDGYFQTELYFQGLKDVFLKDFAMANPLTEETAQFIAKIEAQESVCVHVRLGDYCNHPVHELCDVAYYNKALAKMKELHPDAKLFLFSNEPDKAKELLDIPADVEVESGKCPDYEMMHAMSKCNHFIMANSSFSWWAQYLCEKPNPTVIAPDRWFNIDIPCDIHQSHWTLIPVPKK